MNETVKVKLKVGKNYLGAIWLEGTTPEVDAETAQAWVEAGEAEYATTSAPKRDVNPKPKELDK